MDLRHDNVTLEDTGLPGGAVIDSAASALKNFAGSIRHKAQLTQGISLASQGRYSELTGGMVDRMIEAGVPPEMYMKAPTWLSRPGNAEKAAATLKTVDNPNAVVMNNISKSSILKYGAIALVVGIIIYFISKKL